MLPTHTHFVLDTWIFFLIEILESNLLIKIYGLEIFSSIYYWIFLSKSCEDVAITCSFLGELNCFWFILLEWLSSGNWICENWLWQWVGRRNYASIINVYSQDLYHSPCYCFSQMKGMIQINSELFLFFSTLVLLFLFLLKGVCKGAQGRCWLPNLLLCTWVKEIKISGCSNPFQRPLPELVPSILQYLSQH